MNKKETTSGQDGDMDKMETTTVSKVATWTRWRIPHCVLCDYLDKMEITTVALIATWTRLLHGKYANSHSG